VVLVGQFAPEQVGLLRLKVGQDHGHGLVPPGQAAQVGLAPVVVQPGQVHACQHRAHLGTLPSGGGKFVLPAQLVHHRRRLALHLVEDLAFAVCGRVGHGDALARQVLHQVQIEGQLLEAQSLEQGQHVVVRLALALGGDEIVGVLDAARAASHRHQLAQVQTAQQRRSLGLRDFGIDSHDQKFSRRQLLLPALPLFSSDRLGSMGCTW